jgi:hypothetical protein
MTIQSRHCEERSDEAIHASRADWIASRARNDDAD